MRPPELALWALAAAAGTAVWLYRRSRISPIERERRRRIEINATGRLIEGTITECSGGSIYYRYCWRGIDYDTAQDITALVDYVRTHPETLIGHVTVKFSPGSPYNSIVVCEEWSGLDKAGADKVCRL